MVFKKRLDYGFNGFSVPRIPKAPRSIRRRASPKKLAEDGQICAFELLASLAGKLLQESESSASSNASEGSDHPEIVKDIVKKEEEYRDRPVKTECLDHGSCEVSVVGSDSATESSDDLKAFHQVENDGILERTSIVTKSSCSHKAGGDLNSVISKYKTICSNLPGKGEGGNPNFGESPSAKVENGFEKEHEIKGLEIGTRANTCSPKDPMDLSIAFAASGNSNRDKKSLSCRNLLPNVSFSTHRNGSKLGGRDDDENFSRFYKFSNRFKGSRPPTRIGDRRIRKLLTSKYWKVAPKLKEFEHSRAEGEKRPVYRKRKTCHTRERFQYEVLYKRRKFYDQSSIVTSDGGVSSESVSNSPEKVLDGDKAGGVPSPRAGRHANHLSKDCRVKFSIKSFRIPELFIEVPETATVGSLKRTVMEAISALLGGGLRVGVLLQGKKIRDDSRTLSQTGISCKDSLDSLGFTLEPAPAQVPPLECSEDPHLALPSESAHDVTRFQANTSVDTVIPDAFPDQPSVTNLAQHLDNNNEAISSHTDILTDKTLPDCKALVPVPPLNVEALAVIPVNQKGRKSEVALRRTRRPFSVAEVEALVQAVEELGTGRWRDVKLRAFENAEHRTYVDLKDKWKTLVHTARISPQQRRGEPVPQELLDRVLAAHAYWSQHQAKQQGKASAGTLKLTDAQPDRSGVGNLVM